MKILDNLFDHKYLCELHEEVERAPFVPANIANATTWPYRTEGSHKLFGSFLYRRVSKYVLEYNCPSIIMNAFEYIMLEVLKQELTLLSAHINLQISDQDGSYHTDGTPQLVIFANSIWKKDWGGEFIYRDKAVEKTIDFVPGRVIFFDGNIPHRGLAPTKPNLYRYSINFKLSNNA